MKFSAYRLVLLLAALLCVAGCRPSTHYVTVEGSVLGTTFRIKARTTLPADEIYTEVMALDEEMKHSMSIFDETSLLSRINRGESDSLDSHLIYNILAADSVSRLSDGMYDITVKPLVEAWGFAGKEGQKTPNIDSILPLVGYRKIRIAAHSRHNKDSFFTECQHRSLADASADQHFNITFCQKRCHRLMSVDCGCIEHHSSRQSALVKFINLKRIGVSKMLEHFSRLLIVCYCYFHSLFPPYSRIILIYDASFVNLFLIKIAIGNLCHCHHTVLYTTQCNFCHRNRFIRPSFTAEIRFFNLYHFIFYHVGLSSRHKIPKSRIRESNPPIQLGKLAPYR